jgi:polyisoprenoid-binding protein YceI
MRTLLLLLALTGLVSGESYQVRPAPNGRLALTVEKTGLYRGKKHLFVFEKYQGTLQLDAASPPDSKIELTIDSASAVLKDDWVSAGDMKKILQTTFEDMLAVKKYPSMRFVSTLIAALGGDKYRAEGMLTIRDVSKPVTLYAQWNPATLQIDGTAKLKLTDFKLKPPTALLGAIGTKDEMTLQFAVVATK